MKAARNLRKGLRLQYLVGSLRGLGRTHTAFERPCRPTWKTKLYELPAWAAVSLFVEEQAVSYFHPL